MFGFGRVVIYMRREKLNEYFIKNLNITKSPILIPRIKGNTGIFSGSIREHKKAEKLEEIIIREIAKNWYFVVNGFCYPAEEVIYGIDIIKKFSECETIEFYIMHGKYVKTDEKFELLAIQGRGLVFIVAGYHISELI